MAKNTGDDYRRGSVNNRSQSVNPLTGDYTKRNDATGRFMAGKDGGKPFKGVAREPDGRRSK